MTGDRIVRKGIRVIAMIIMVIDIVEQTAHMLAQRVIQNQERVRFRTADRFRLLEQIRDATVIDAVLEPRRFGEEAGEVGFVSTLQHTAGDVGQTFVVQDDQTCQVILEMVKLAPILKEIAKEDWPTDGLDGDTNIRYGVSYIDLCYSQHGSSSVYGGDPLKNIISCYNLGRSSGPSRQNESNYVNPVVGYYDNYKNKYISL